MVYGISVLFILFYLFFYLKTSTSLNCLALNQSIQDGESLVSADGTFEVGFFSPGNSTGRYLGIWYRNVSPLTVVWVANRGAPLQNNTGVLKLDEEGVLVILNGTNNTLWSSNISSKAMNNPIAQLSDSGNLVVKDGQDADNFLWQSFEYPCGTFLPGMKLGWNLETGLERFLSSWRSEDDPAVGEYTIKIDLRGYPQFFVFEGSAIRSRPGSWNGMALTGYPTHQLTQNYRYEFVLNEKEVYYEYIVIDRLIFYMLRLTPSGVGQRLLWTRQTKSVRGISTVGGDPCENYAFCGANSVCNLDGNSPSCECLKGFVPKFPEQWNISYWSNGCVRDITLDCNDKDGFLKYTDIKLPDTSSSWYHKTMTLEECRNLCLKNCSCSSFANLDIRNGGSGCLLWFGDLIDMKKFSEGGQDIYTKVPNSVLDNAAGNEHGNKKLKGIIIGVVLSGLAACACMMIIIKRWVARFLSKKHDKNKLMKEKIDLPTFDLSTIVKATENFSTSNKLGEGGFGPVYKGILIDGQELAVKRLLKKSRQGMDEFKNEVMLIAKLQHRNLVKILGCCIQAEEKMLIYEYMPNKSLDYFIFDQTKRKFLDWFARFNIISGIARGLLYLHQDSRLKIIHRDLKTSNILLDTNFDPKISDFGLARTFLSDQVEANTNKIVGTYGYMSPEYAVHGYFLMKLDIFSYGVIVLEIVSGKRNRDFLDSEHSHNLLGHAWKLWTDEQPLELLDEVLRERNTPSDVIRCIQAGLLCVQQRPEDRPDLSSVVLMLNGEKLLPKPKVPGFYIERDVLPQSDSSPTNCNMFSANAVSITMLDAR